jgi:hypothetical protein
VRTLPSAETIQALQEQLRRRRRLHSTAVSAVSCVVHPQAGNHTVRRGQSSLARINTDYSGHSVPNHQQVEDTHMHSAALQQARAIARAARGSPAPRPPSPVASLGHVTQAKQGQVRRRTMNTDPSHACIIFLCTGVL